MRPRQRRGELPDTKDYYILSGSLRQPNLLPVPSPLGERVRLKIPPEAGVRGKSGHFENPLTLVLSPKGRGNQIFAKRRVSKYDTR